MWFCPTEGKDDVSNKIPSNIHHKSIHAENRYDEMWGEKIQRSSKLFFSISCSYRVEFPKNSPDMYLILIALDWAHFLSSLSFIKFQNGEFEHVLSSKSTNFWSLSLNLCSSISSIGSSNASISDFIEFKFHENPNQAWVLWAKI